MLQNILFFQSQMAKRLAYKIAGDIINDDLLLSNIEHTKEPLFSIVSLLCSVIV